MMSMSEPQYAPLAHRVGPQLAGAIKTTARRYVESGLTYRETAIRIETETNVPITATAVRFWAKRSGWEVVPKPPPPPRKGRCRDIGKREAEADAATKCRKRCPICAQLIQPGETHICQMRAGRVLTMFGGGWL